MKNSIPKAAALFTLAALASAPLVAQEPGPLEAPASQPSSQKPKLPGKLKAGFQDPYAKLIPGALPVGTSPEAAHLFDVLTRTTLKPGTERAPLTGFDIAFEIITRGTGVERNQAKVRVRYEEPASVRFSLDGDKEMGYGPRGYWQRFEDGAKYLEGREYAPDRKRIAGVRSTAKNFLALADPARLRLVSVRALPGAPGHVPPGFEKRASELTWLELASPDFDLAAGGAADTSAASAPRLFRATLGLDPKSGRVLEALIAELDENTPLVETSTWVSLKDPMDIGDSLLPSTVEVRYADLTAKPWSFSKKPSEELYILDGRLNPGFAPGTFEAPRK